VTSEMPDNQAEHTLRTREAYDRLAAVWSSTTDEGPFNGLLERPALRALVPGNLHGAAVLDAGCGSGAQAQWLLEQGADIVCAERLDSTLSHRWYALPGEGGSHMRQTLSGGRVGYGCRHEVL
jgi:2-polyprenyl-3-methyl-5-hydroxy-6-metoxy-1,4-benzoquinol methylase